MNFQDFICPNTECGSGVFTILATPITNTMNCPYCTTPLMPVDSVTASSIRDDVELDIGFLIKRAKKTAAESNGFITIPYQHYKHILLTIEKLQQKGGD